MKKTLFILLALSPIMIGLWLLNVEKYQNIDQVFDEKVYVALEDEGRVAVIDTKNQKVLRSIDLTEYINMRFVRYAVHNVQVAPNGSLVLASANVRRGAHGQSSEEEEDLSDGLLDKIFIIDPLTDTIIESIPIALDSHLAHVVVNSDSTKAYVALQETGQIAIIDLPKKTVLSMIDLGTDSEPHGLRLLTDDSKLAVALVEGKALAMIDTKNNAVKYYDLPGKGVQTAVAPNGQYVFISLYDTKQIATLDLRADTLDIIDLPAESKGPIQIYPSPDSQFLYIADQGYYFEQATGNMVHRLNVATKTIDKSIAVGSAPHGLVVDRDGELVYVTNLLSEDVSVIDTRNGQEKTRIKVGKTPNGISIWNQKTGGTP